MYTHQVYIWWMTTCDRIALSNNSRIFNSIHYLTCVSLFLLIALLYTLSRFLTMIEASWVTKFWLSVEFSLGFDKASLHNSHIMTVNQNWFNNTHRFFLLQRKRSPEFPPREVQTLKDVEASMSPKLQPFLTNFSNERSIWCFLRRSC